MLGYLAVASARMPDGHLDWGPPTDLATARAAADREWHTWKVPSGWISAANALSRAAGPIPSQTRRSWPVSTQMIAFNLLIAAFSEDMRRVKSSIAKESRPNPC